MFYNWYIRGLFEPTKYHKEKFKGINPTTIPDQNLLEMICEITGMTELEVINQACDEIRERNVNFEWNFDEYFRGLQLQLHPKIREELRKAYFDLHKE